MNFNRFSRAYIKTIENKNFYHTTKIALSQIFFLMRNKALCNLYSY